jgi:hypothetical protein
MQLKRATEVFKFHKDNGATWADGFAENVFASAEFVGRRDGLRTYIDARSQKSMSHLEAFRYVKENCTSLVDA